MKKTLCLFLVLVSIFVFSGCDNSYEISGLENFSKNICSMGTCDGLLPTDSLFLSDHPYVNGDFHYWTDGDYTQAKAFVRLQYSEHIYLYKKSICENYYSVPQTQYQYEDFLFSEPNLIYEDITNIPDAGMQMFGYDDATCTLVFISCYGYEFDRCKTITPSLFNEFFSNEFGRYLV